jgi:molybdenum transport protein
VITLSDVELIRLLDDDVPCGDLTTETLGIGDLPGRLRFSARQPMTICAVEEAARLFVLAGATARVLQPSGAALAAGEIMLEAEGSATALHHAWKTAQVLVEWASGIATATAAIVTAANCVAVACTRKNVPGTKTLSAKAVRAGGATMHRLGLSESLLIFAEHRQFLADTPADTVVRVKQAEPEKKFVVEVASVDEALIWARAGADVLQLEKFTPAEVAVCRRVTSADILDKPLNNVPQLLLAAAGGINAANAAAYAAAGADLLVTSAPYTAAPRDVAVAFEAC